MSFFLKELDMCKKKLVLSEELHGIEPRQNSSLLLTTFRWQVQMDKSLSNEIEFTFKWDRILCDLWQYNGPGTMKLANTSTITCAWWQRFYFWGDIQTIKSCSFVCWNGISGNTISSIETVLWNIHPIFPLFLFSFSWYCPSYGLWHK